MIKIMYREGRGMRTSASVATQKETADFLNIVKCKVSSKDCEFVTREYTNSKGQKVSWRQALSDLEIIGMEQVWYEVMNLSTNNYVGGPENDHNGSPEKIWIFKKEVNKMPAYIKLKIDRRGCVCLSFHEDW